MIFYSPTGFIIKDTSVITLRQFIFLSIHLVFVKVLSKWEVPRTNQQNQKYFSTFSIVEWELSVLISNAKVLLKWQNKAFTLKSFLSFQQFQANERLD